MSNDSPNVQQVQDLFLRVVELPTADRAAALDHECGTHTAMRRRLEALLRAHDESDSLLDRRGENFDAAVITDSAEADGTDGNKAKLIPGLEGAVIAGRYTMLEKIGEGGMGEVWVAKQTDPVKRRVAVKVIKAGMDSRAVLARFDQERQALALMDHPNIARVLDGGATPTGQPFFVMELVNGLPLNSFCDEARLATKERLELFVTICHAVQHAHQKGIVHRDLKPANVLITMIDGRPVPKVIDFGVAKATSGRITDESMSTQFGAVVGTLEYMAPEQAGFSGEDIDTRADIYSLGVILYEMLTGLRPIDSSRLKKAALTEMIRMIREEEPSKPSTRLSTDDSLPSMAALRRIEPKKLTALLRGELDWVVMKCLEKQRDRRYETANGLACDILRYLADEPVEARPPSARYRFSKFLQRNKGQVIVANFVFIALATSVAFVVAVQARANRDLDAKNEELASKNTVLAAEQAKVQARFELARKAIETFHTGVSEDTLLKNQQFDELRTKLLKEASQFYGQLETLLKDEKDRGSRIALADCYEELADLTERIASFPEAIAVMEKVVSIRKDLAAEADSERTIKIDLARAIGTVGRWQIDSGEMNKGLQTLQEQKKILDVLEPNEELLILNIEYLQNIGRVFTRSARNEEALVSFLNAVDSLQALINGSPDNHDHQSTLANTFDMVANLQSVMGQKSESLETSRKAEAIWRKLLDDHPKRILYSQGLLRAQGNMSGVLSDMGKLDEALDIFQQGLIVKKKIAEVFPAVTSYQYSVAISHQSIGITLARMNRHSEAINAYQAALVILTNIMERDSSATDIQLGMSKTLAGIGKSLEALGQRSEALASYERAVIIHQKIVDADAADKRTLLSLRDNLIRSGSLLVEMGRTDEAIEHLSRSQSISKKLLDANPGVPEFELGYADGFVNIASIQSKAEQTEEAIHSFGEALALLKALADANPENPVYRFSYAKTSVSCAAILHKAGKDDDSEMAYNEGVKTLKELTNAFPQVPAYEAAFAASMNNQASVLLATGKLEQGLDVTRQSIELLKKQAERNPEMPASQLALVIGYKNLAQVLSQLRRADEMLLALDEEVSILSRLRDSKPLSAEYSERLVSTYCRRGLARFRLDKRTEAAVDLKVALKLWEEGASTASVDSFDRCCVFATLAVLADESHSEISSEEKSAFADQAVNLLRLAINDGWNQAEELAVPMFDSVRDREDFKTMVSKLGEAPKPDSVQ